MNVQMILGSFAAGSSKLSAALASLFLFAQFAVATRTHFVANKEISPGLTLLGVTSVLGFVSFLYFLEETDRISLSAFFAYAFSQLAFIWTKKSTQTASLGLAYSRDLPHALVEAGPYKWIRHPFYSSYILYWVGNAFAAPTLAQWVICGMLCVIYFCAARFEERKFYQSPLRKAYEEYRERTTMFVPYVL